MNPTRDKLWFHVWVKPTGIVEFRCLLDDDKRVSNYSNCYVLKTETVTLVFYHYGESVPSTWLLTYALQMYEKCYPDKQVDQTVMWYQAKDATEI